MSTSARRYLLRITLLLCIVGGVATGLYYAYNARRLILEKTDARLHSAVVFLHELLGEEFHDRITDGESLSADEFQSLLDRNDDLCRRLGLQYLWSVLVLDEDRIVFTSATRSDLSDPGSAHAAFFETHRDPRAFDGATGAPGQPVFSSFHNEWGAGRMVLIPHLDADGRRYILGASLRTTALRTLMGRAAGYGLLMAGALFTLIWFVMRSRILHLTQVLSALDEAAVKMAGGDLEVILPTSDLDEVRNVCASLETMRREIKKRIEDLVRSSNRERRKSEMLSRLTHGESLEHLLDAVVRFTEQEDASIRGSILLFDPKRNVLLPGAAPSLPSDYNALMEEGLPIGPNVGSCGTAAFTRKLAIAADIQTNPRWTPYAAFIEKTREHDLKACWSLPIFSATGEVLGAFANYSNRIGEPTPVNLATLTWAADLAGLAIEKHQDKCALRESEEQYRSLFDGSIAAIYVFNVNKRFVDTNQAGIELLGYTREELQLMSMQDADVDSAAVAHAHQRLISGGKLVNFEHSLKRKDGTTITVLNNSSPLTNAEGKMIGTISTLIDITAQKQAEEDLRHSEQRFKGILQNVATVAVQGYALDGTVRYWNSASETFYGYTAEEAIGRNLLELGFVPPSMHDGLREEIRQLAQTGQVPPAYELELLRKDGTRIPIYSSYAFVKVPGQEAEFFCIDIDLSDQKRAEAEHEQIQLQLAQAQKLESIGRLAGGVAHDFNNMLQVILGYTEELMDHFAEGDDKIASLEEIDRSAKRSRDLTRQLLAFARQQVIDPRPLNLNELVEQMLNMLRRLIGENIEIVWRPDSEATVIKMDPSQIDQMLVNLCVNARDAISGSGKITIGTESRTVHERDSIAASDAVPGDYVVLTVSDDGSGMTEEVLGQLFEPFFTTKVIGKGVGLGLATVYGIVKQNAGFIEVCSAIGAGTTFRIYIPRLKDEYEPAADSKVEDSQETLRGTETVLLTEDEAAVRTMTAMNLEHLGYTVLSAENAKRALEISSEFSGEIHVLMTDVVMPGISGVELAKRLSRMRPSLKVIYMSGYTPESLPNHHSDDIESTFLCKPFNRADLSRTVRDVLT